MKPLFKNNIFTNPGGWAQKVIDTPFRYRFMQASTVCLGIMLGIMIALISEKTPSADYIGVSGFLNIIVVMLPLCYLRALHHFVVISQSERTGSKG